MDDLTIIKACAEAMGYGDLVGPHYNPLTDDAQAMALVKALRMTIVSMHYGEKWHAIIPSAPFNCDAIDPDLNRAICLAVAQRGKE